MKRIHIDWKNLETLPRKRSDGKTKEDLADLKFQRSKAKHHGRCHIFNWQRRKSKEQSQIKGKEKSDANAQKHKSYKNRVRAFWAGKIDEHP